MGGESGKSKEVLINAANLHGGGGMQVAQSFIIELYNAERLDYHILVSSEVDQELRLAGLKAHAFRSYKVHDAKGILALIDRRYRDELSGYGLVFTVFGPLYRFKKPTISIVGFAQPWIIYPENEISKSLGIVRRLITRLKYWIQLKFYENSDIIVVELNHVRERLKELCSLKHDVYVVNNCVSSVFFDEQTWRSVEYEPPAGELVIGTVSRDYQHKNLDVLPKVKKILKEKYDVAVRFVVTLNDQEWRNKSVEFCESIDNAGALSITQCPDFYGKIEGVILPSFLECFSATPIEALSASKPLFLADRPFNRQICSEYATYFDPMDPEDIAEKIYRYYFLDGDENRSNADKRNYAQRFCNPDMRAAEYVRIIREYQLDKCDV